VTLSTRNLERLAGIIWLLVGAMLIRKGVTGFENTSTLGLWIALPVGLVVGALKGKYVLSRTARRNRRRIRSLSEPKLWNVFTGKFLILIALMIGLAQGLQALAEAGHFSWAALVGIRLGIGAGLMVSAFVLLLPPPKPYDTDVAPAASGVPRGVLLVNLGSPASPSTRDVRRYLREFLSDPLVVEANRLLWAFVLNVIILPRRAGRSAAAYAKVWSDEGSPLVANGRRLTECVTRSMGSAWSVRLAMRYGAPALHEQLDALAAEGCREIRVVPLFPQWSRTTNGTIQDSVTKWAKGRRAGPAVSIAPSCPDDPGYLQALGARVREAIADSPVNHHVFSFHGLPESYIERGDPYVRECRLTAAGLANELGLADSEWTFVFQSRFGDDPWLQPYADEKVPELAAQYPRIAITLPGFAADCLETLEEIAMELADDFREAGGEELVIVPALNDHPIWVETVARMAAGPGLEVPNEMPQDTPSLHEARRA
jgi:protoporphyrin/coproporphyrin ferrochelatase